MSDEQRAARTTYEDGDQRSAGHGRLEGERTPTYRGEYLHYRDDYGTSMDDLSYQSMNEQQESFWDQIDSNKSIISSNKRSLESDYASGLEEISSAQSEVDSSSFSYTAEHIPTYEEIVADKLSTGEWTTVSVFDNGSLLAVHNLPVDTANDYISSVSSAGGNAWDDEGRLGVDVEGYGEELHHPIVYAEQDAIASYNASYDAAVAAQEASIASAESDYNAQVEAANLTISTSTESLNASYADAEAQIASQEAQLQSQIDANQKALDTIRNKYSSKLSTVTDTIKGIFNARMGEEE